MKKLLASLAILLCVGCAKEINSDITSFSYNLDYGLGGYCSYNIDIIEEKVIYKKECIGTTTADLEKEIDKSYLAELKDLINENGIYKWDGFDKNNNNVMDGSGFTLAVHYANDESISAHGYMRFPSNYSEVKGKLLDFLDKLD